MNVCIEIASLNRASSQDLFWPSHVGPSRGIATNYTCMPFDLENADASFERLARLAMAPHKTSAPHEAPRLRSQPTPKRRTSIALFAKHPDAPAAA